MKFNVLRAILIPWILFFVLSVIILVLISLKLPAQMQDPRIHWVILALGAFGCLFANFATMNKAGIWIADLLPYSVRDSSWSWFMRAVVAAAIAFTFYLVGQAAWMPLYWQGFVIPSVFTLSVFVIVRSLMGVALKAAANVMFIRLFIVILSLPLLFGVGLTALFLGHTIVSSYEASQPEFVPKSFVAPQIEVVKSKFSKEEIKPVQAGISKRAKQFQAASESAQACPNLDKEIRGSLDPKTGEDIAYWAIKAVKCSDMKSAIVLPRLVEIMIKHKSARVRAAAITMMTKYNRETLKPIGYLLVKHLNDTEPKEVLEADAAVLAKLGEEERSSATKRLKVLLDSADSSQTAAEILIHQMNRSDLVAAYVSEHLGVANESRNRAIAMICLLPESDRTKAEPFISGITSAIKQGSSSDPAMEALACMGPAGLKAVRQEVQTPQKISRPLAAQALAEMDLKNDAETLKTVESCLKDENEEVRKWCSHSMGKIGKLALPQILDLLKSKDPVQLESGHLALESFTDPDAKEELRKVRAENSGWMANRKNLQVASAVSSALVRIENRKN